MARRKIFTLAFLILVVSIPAFAFPDTPDDAARQISQVTEFEVNGLKVLVKRRPSAPTVAGGLFIKGGARNITDKNAGIENLMLASAVDAGKKFPQQTVRREISRTGSGIGSTPAAITALFPWERPGRIRPHLGNFHGCHRQPGFQRRGCRAKPPHHPYRPARIGKQPRGDARRDAGTACLRRPPVRK